MGTDVIFNCYQCDKVAYLFEDSRCATCTRVNPATGGLDKEDDYDVDSSGFGNDDTQQLQAQG